MSNLPGLDIIICEQSAIIQEGLMQIVKHDLSNNYTIDSCGTIESVLEYLNIRINQILIAKPELLDQISNLDFPLLKTIGLVYAYYDHKVLKKYEGIIRINDPKTNVLKSIHSVKLSFSSRKSNELPALGVLTKRETEVLIQLVSGMSTKELAKKLFISVHTVNNHRKNIIKKLGISTMSGLTIYSVIHKLIDPNQIITSLK